jgi:hypothetical protein
MRQRKTRRRGFSLAVDTELWDDDVLWELPAGDRKRVRDAMTWGRPLPPRLARVAVQHAPMMQTQAWYGFRLMALSLIFELIGWPILVPSTGLLHAMGLSIVTVGVLWLLIGVIWLRAVARSRRTGREGYWPERSGQ